jgi:hypothetical protein
VHYCVMQVLCTETNLNRSESKTMHARTCECVLAHHLTHPVRGLGSECGQAETNILRTSIMQLHTCAHARTYLNSWMFQVSRQSRNCAMRVCIYVCACSPAPFSRASRAAEWRVGGCACACAMKPLPTLAYTRDSMRISTVLVSQNAQAIYGV